VNFRKQGKSVDILGASPALHTGDKILEWRRVEVVRLGRSE